MALKDLTDSDFNLFRKLIYEKSGISLNDTKKELLRSRLRKRLDHEGYRSYREYYEFVSQDRSNTAIIQLLDDISTNLTSFYREMNHFNFLNEQLPPLMEEKLRERSTVFRIWSAGCSTGEEPYTLAFLMLGHLANKMPPWQLKILATDLSTDVLRRASTGVYDAERLKDVPTTIARSYFDKEPSDGKRDLVRVRQEVRQYILFKRLNLMQPQFPFKNMFDFIFCRNVMIYFDKPTQEALVGKYYRHLKPGGYLFIGHSESLTGLKHQFKYIKPTIYRK